MTVQVEISSETEARLQAEAVLRGLSLQNYLGQLLEQHSRQSAAGTGRLTPDQLKQLLDVVGQGSESRPSLPTSAFSRESFYEDRM